VRPRSLLIALCLAVSTALPAATFTVTSTADSGAGSLRAAIESANATPGADTIAFGIVGTGPHTIALASALPNITEAVTIDGYTQAGSSPNTQPTTQGLNTVLMIVIDGAGSGVPGTLGCMTSAASNVTIRGLVMNRCPGYQIRLQGAVSNNVVAGNFLGTTYDGLSVPAGASAGGVLQVSQTGTRIGGTAPADRNLIAGVGNPLSIGASGVAGTDVVVEGNLLGTDKTGLVSLGNLAGYGIDVTGGHGVRIGGPTAASRNVVGRFSVGMVVSPLFTNATDDILVQGNFIGTDVTGTRLLPTALAVSQGIFTGFFDLGDGFEILGNTIGGFITGIDTQQTSGLVIRGNFIGTDSTGTHDLGNQLRGIRFANSDDMVIGGAGGGQGNWIAFNSMAGIEGSSGQAEIRGNRIWNNKSTSPQNGLGIDLSGNLVLGVNINDAGDADTGPNGQQNFPFLTATGPGLVQAGGTHIQGFLDSAPSTQYTLDFYSNPACANRPQELAEGQDYIGSAQVTTDGSGHATIDVTLGAVVEPGARITATATDPDGNTSEFSPRLIFSMSPGSGAPAGGSNVAIAGMMFEDGATVTIGGLPAGSVDVVSPTQITATAPALAAGSLNNVVVTNPSGTSGTLVNGWVADFADVPGGQQFYVQITKLVANAITVGCGTGIYCPLNSVTRQQMAVFLLKSKNGLCYVPPPCTGVFPDVPCSSNFAPWIEALAEAGITGGCGGGNYCPTNPVIRQQMAVFLLKTKHGSSFVPPPCNGDFGDVACPGNPFADWIEELAEEGITGGCGGGNYCPNQSVRRDQMAAFLGNTFQF
jgi:hypothetical protein